MWRPVIVTATEKTCQGMLTTPRLTSIQTASLFASSQHTSCTQACRPRHGQTQTGSRTCTDTDTDTDTDMQAHTHRQTQTHTKAFHSPCRRLPPEALSCQQTAPAQIPQLSQSASHSRSAILCWIGCDEAPWHHRSWRCHHCCC